jgi:molybdopterin/thiamine biosynthesis adenylyltransferase
MAGFFVFEDAFARNIGWLTEREQQLLRGSRVAIAGMGGVGGAHLLALTRTGIGEFNIADLDRFEVVNFNRQVGAAMSTVGRPKVETMAEAARDINPELTLGVFSEGVSDDNLDAFLDGVDLFVDGLDFFVPDVRSRVFGRCAELGIPAITAAPIGFGTAYMVFMPGQMTFEEYFGLEGRPHDEQLLRMLTGLVPRPSHLSYLVDRNQVDLAGHRAPSTGAACQLCASVTATEAVKILTGRGRVWAAPWRQRFDPFTGELVRKRNRLGHRSPLAALRRNVARRLMPASQTVAPGDSRPESEMHDILDLARWAPSGDNTQPWRFEIRADDEVLIHLTDDRDHDVYDYAGRGTLLSVGTLLECLRLSASRFGRRLDWAYTHSGGSEHRIVARLPRDFGVREDRLHRMVRVRSVDRRRYRLRALTAEQHAALEDVLGPELSIKWLTSLRDRFRATRINALATDVRLRSPEAQRVHAKVVDFEHALSGVGVSAKSLGLDPATLRLMRWAMADAARTRRVTAALGTAGPILQMDVVPGLMCGAHALIAFADTPAEAQRAEALLRAGERLQRLWLEATRLGLALQPSFAPLSFAYYAEHDIRFTEAASLRRGARRIAKRLRAIWPLHDSESRVFAFRIGVPQPGMPAGRSVRRPLSELLVERSETMPELVASPRREALVSVHA